MKTIDKDGKVDWGSDVALRDGSPAAIFGDGTWCWYLPEALTIGRYIHMSADGKVTVTKIKPDPERAKP